MIPPRPWAPACSASLPPGPPSRRAAFPSFYDTNVSLTGRAGKDRYGERMPKRVDHEERRQQIAEALLRTAAARGLHAAGMREVAADAGVSLRLVQYYFGTKEELLLAGMQYLAARFAARAAARFKEASRSEVPASPRDVIAAILAEALPADDDRRTFHVIYTAYLALSLTDPALAIAPLVKNSDTVTGVVAAQLRAAQAAGDTPPRLDRLFPASRPALHPAPMKLPVTGNTAVLTAAVVILAATLILVGITSLVV